MSAAVRPLNLYDLLAPQFLAGFQFPDYVDKYLSLLAVADLQTTSDVSGVLYTGTVFFPSSPGSPPVLQHRDPNGAIFDFHDTTLQFRLLIPRAGSAPVKTVIDTIAGIDAQFVPVQQIVNSFGAQNATGTDYPGIGFQLELLVSILTFHLGSDWKPAKQNSDFTVTADPSAATQDVRILMPKILLRYTQGQDFTQAPDFKLASWGDPGFDAPNDLSEGELATMDPPLAIHSSGRVAFGIDEIILDLSEDSTPPEILAHFGTDQSFEGLYVKALQVYYADADKDFALNFAVRDALISFKGEVSLEAELDLLFGDKPFSVSLRMYDGNRSLPVNVGTRATTGTPPPNTWTGGSATIPPTGVIYLQVAGGTPPFTYAVDFTPDGGGGVEHLWDDSARQAKFSPAPTANTTGTLTVTVTDSSTTPQTYSNTMALNVRVQGTPSLPPPNTSLAQAVWHADARPAGIPDEDTIQFTPSPSGTTETLVVQGGSGLPTVRVNGTPYAMGADRQVIVDVLPDAVPINIEVDYSASNLPGEFDLFFHFDKPESVADESRYVSPGAAPADDPEFTLNTVPSGVPGGGAHTGADALRYWVANALDLTKPIQITATASNEGHTDKVPYNQSLSRLRGDVAQQIVQSAGGSGVTVSALGQTGDTSSNPADRKAAITGTPKGSSGYTLTGNLTRAATPAPAPTPAPTTAPAAPGPPTNSKPTVLRRISFRVRLERNVPVLMEVSGEIDFETETEQSLRNASGQSGSLGLQNTPAASRNPADGIVDFTLNVTWDPATRDLTETLTLGAAPADIDGLVRMTNPSPYSTLKNIFGAVLVFTPILNAVTTALDPNSAGDWTAIAVDLGVPVAIGALGFINTTDVTLFGGQLQLRENIPGGSDPAKFTNASLTFDYSVGFRIDVDALDIHSSRSMSVRYKAVGVNLHFGEPAKFEFVLDTSKGYSLDLSDPALFNLPAPLGDLLKIAAARIARFNPLTIELDLEIKADLGIITVDKFLVKIPLDGTSSPTIIPSGVKVNIPATLVGSGTVSIDSGGFQGTIDITLVPLKLRIAASVGVEHITDGSREATAFYLGLEVDFPAPIILGSTGLGLFGLFGLFGMNYAMKEDPPVPGDAVGPDLKWLIASGGAPYKLLVDNPPPQGATTLWQPKIDSWAFGVGVVLGTVEGFLLDLRGAFILELPGPRIIITVNLEFITSIEGMSSPDGMDPASLDVGIIGILDIDIGAGQITLGVMINLEISELISIQIPVSLFFDWNQPSDWHFWIGTISTPASADILGIVRGGGYFMMGGQAITPFPPGSTGSLPGVAVALGIFASIVWGSESVGIYLKVAARADFGVSFSPKLFIVGRVHLEGELRLIIVSIGASGDFLVKAPDPLYLAVHICGSVSFFFFSISACVDFSIGTDSNPPLPPPLIAKTYLQSFAPVIASGQGGDRPIDASLGDAPMVAASGLPGLSPGSGPEPLVPIDSVPVLQLQFGVDVSTVTQTFTTPLPACVTYPGNPGVSLGGGRYAHYKLTKLLINPPLPAGVTPPVAWRPNKPATDTTESLVDLALFSRNPNVVNSAVERSTELTNTLLGIWGEACQPIAPPACVFWTLCGQRLGPSPDAWKLYGTPTVDPPGTKRTTPVPTALQVEQPSLSAADALLLKFGLPITGKGLYPAQVIGLKGAQNLSAGSTRERCMRALELPEELAQGFKTGLGREIKLANPAEVTKKVVAIVADNRWLRFDTGQSKRVRLLLGIQPEIYKLMQGPAAAKWILIRERDSKGNLVLETPLTALNPKIVSAMTDLPGSWSANPGPWFLEAVSVVTYLATIELTRVFIQIKPRPETTVIEVAYKGDDLKRPTVVVGAIESCPASETIRYENGVVIQQSTIQQIQTYLDGGSPVPLLEKDTEYTITVDYDVTVTEQDGSTNDHSGVTQAWMFKTAKDIPRKLDPWVLTTSPDQNEKFVFYQDTVDVIFNDRSVVQLFAKLGYQLELDLRAADGLPDTTAAPVTTTSIDGVGTAAYDSLHQLVALGKLPCVGTTSQYQNQKFTAPVTLRPLMGYTLDINTNPSTTPPPDPTKAVAPLFRRSFNTGRYPTMKALAQDLGASLVTHRALKQKLTFPASGHTVTPDQDIQNAFVLAGEQALPAPEKNAIVMYWAPASPGGPYVPHAILIDSVEPLWRTRPEPGFTNPIPSDPSFRIVTIGPKTSLEVVEQGGPAVGGYVVSPGSTRTVALFAAGFSPPPGGTTVTLALHRPPSTVYGNADEADVIIALPVAPQAPWENDHV